MLLCVYVVFCAVVVDVNSVVVMLAVNISFFHQSYKIPLYFVHILTKGFIIFYLLMDANRMYRRHTSQICEECHVAYADKI